MCVYQIVSFSLFYPVFTHLFLSVAVLDCKIGNGDTYRGPTSITILGVTCQAWSAQSPHQHNSFTPQSHPTKGLEGNVSVFMYEPFLVVDFSSNGISLWI